MFDKLRESAAKGMALDRSADAGRQEARQEASQEVRQEESHVALMNQGPTATAKAVIGPSIVIKGELSGDEDIVIAGEFEGSIDLPNQAVTVTESGQVRADVKANVVEIQGELHGDVDGVGKVLITKTGRMQGNIVSPRVILDDGAKFKGSIDMNPSGVAAPKPAKPKPAASAPPAAGGQANAASAAGAASANRRAPGPAS